MKSLQNIALFMLDLVAVREGGTVAEALAIALRTAQHAERLGFKRYWLAGLTPAKSSPRMPPPWRVPFFNPDILRTLHEPRRTLLRKRHLHHQRRRAVLVRPAVERHRHVSAGPARCPSGFQGFRSISTYTARTAGKSRRLHKPRKKRRPMSAPTREAMPLLRWGAGLGYAGLVPFVALAVATWLAPPAYRAHAAHALLAYGATIASFLGAIHWGLAMREPRTPQPGSFVWGVFPSLVAWVALLLPLSQGLVTLALLLGICLAVDWRSYPAYGRKWLTMRLHLTLVAGVCLLAGAGAA